jgi:hypothetical protein
VPTATGQERLFKIDFRTKKASAHLAPGLMERSLALTVRADLSDSDFRVSPASSWSTFRQSEVKLELTMRLAPQRNLKVTLLRMGQGSSLAHRGWPDFPPSIIASLFPKSTPGTIGSPKRSKGLSSACYLELGRRISEGRVTLSTAVDLVDLCGEGGQVPGAPRKAYSLTDRVP